MIDVFLLNLIHMNLKNHKENATVSVYTLMPKCQHQIEKYIFQGKFLVREVLVTFSLENVITNPSLTLISKTHFTYFYMRILFLYQIFINYYKWTNKEKKYHQHASK